MSDALQIVAVTSSIALTLAGVALLARAAGVIVRVVRTGVPDRTRTGDPAARTATLAREFLGHTRMARLPLVAIAHWFTMISFGLLFLSLVTAYGQLFDPGFALVLLGHFPPYEWAVEVITLLGLAGIVTLIVVRQRHHPRREGRASRFYGSSFWQAYYVELTILGVLVCVAALRGLEYALDTDHRGALHYPLGQVPGRALTGLSVGTLENAVVAVAAVKIAISMAWAITIGLRPTMGVAWHRFLAFPNIWFKRHPVPRAGGSTTSLGALQPISVDGSPLDFENLDELDEDAALGVGAVENFTWKGLLDFSTCTECGRCQSQCPAWNTEKPLSPKMLVLALRDHSHAKAPWLAASEELRQAVPDWPDRAQAERPLVGPTGYEDVDLLGAYGQPGGVIDPDVLWSCVTCGACVEQCPVDIEHVDHIVDLRRYQVLIESAFPNELNGLFKNLEKNANPWGVAPRLRLDWAKDLPFEVRQVGTGVEDLSEVEYLFWVGCAGAYEDRQKKTTRAIAELLHTAGVDFAVLGDGEACTGDPARRSGNEFLFQQLAMQNVEVLNEAGARKIVVSCAHCFNTLANEYPQLGGHYQVVHHTQLLNRLVREGRLTPVAAPDAGPTPAPARSVTYHDPCYIGRHNGIYAPPRELIGALPGVNLAEMPRNSERSFCCGAGGARMWMEEKLGRRINLTRTDEALATGAETIAVGCPFCRVMLSDGLTTRQSEGTGEGVEVLDVAQLLLAAVRRTPTEPSPVDPG
jgi:Fe-S oxidoreductase